VIPDLSDESKMARVGRLSTLYRAQKQAAQLLRDKATVLLHHLDDGQYMTTQGIPELCAEIEEITRAIRNIKDSA